MTTPFSFLCIGYFRGIRYLKFTLLFSSILFLFSCQQTSTTPATLLITNANIWTGNPKQMSAEAMAIVGDSILAVGTVKEMEAFKGTNTEIQDLQGAFVTPGFIDCHVHIMMGGNALLSVELRDAATPEEFTKRIADYAKTLEAGKWILEGNWDHTLWGGELPTKTWIDEYTSENPVVLYRLDGHMVLANSLALEIAGIDKNTPDLPGGKIIRDKKGFPTGILKGTAMNVLLNKIPSMTTMEKEKALQAAMDYLLSNGVTSVHDVDSLGTYDIAQQVRKTKELPVRIYTFDPLYRWKQFAKVNRESTHLLKTGGLKGFVDGSLGSHTAAFHEDYSDKANDRGFFTNNKKDLLDWTLNADKADFQITVHAIGDSAIHALLDIYEQVIANNGQKDRRFRIEHAQHLAAADIKRFDELKVIASMQPYHAIDDGRWAEELIGAERIKTTYAFKSLLDAKARVVFGSDWPVAPAAPILGIYAAVTRRTLDNKNPDGWIPAQKITVEQALIAYTRDAAYASFEENIKGTLEVGKLADFVVINADLTQIDPVKIKDAKVLQTYVGGQKFFDNMEN